MRAVIKRIGLTALFMVLSIGQSYAQFQENIKGTIGNEKMGLDEIVVCVYGTASCMPLKIDTTQTVKFEGKDTKINQLPFGLYLEAEIGTNSEGRAILRNISINQDKTVICFMGLQMGQDKKLDELLRHLEGVKLFKLNKVSNQVYIEYDHKIISYSQLEDTITMAGFNLE
jgi:hypothetical protein